MADDIIQQAEEYLNGIGLNVFQLINALGKSKSKAFNLCQEDKIKFKQIFEEIDNGCQDTGEKGKKLEELTSILFNSQNRSFFECKRNIRTSSNEIDLFLSWSEEARINQINNVFTYFGDYFLCECKNYDGKVSVTYAGKFFSLLSLANAKLGILIAWEGITGRGKWDSANGLIRKIALKEGVLIIPIDKHDLKKIYDDETNIYSLVNEKCEALLNDIDYSKFVSKHMAEDEYLNT